MLFLRNVSAYRRIGVTAKYHSYVIARSVELDDGDAAISVTIKAAVLNAEVAACHGVAGGEDGNDAEEI